jgi:peroxiredoxin
LITLFAAASFSFGADLPKFVVEDVDGDQFRFEDLIGKKVIVIDFWATYCIQCKPQLDVLEKLYKKYKEKDVEVIIVSVDTPQNRSKVKPYFKARKYSFTVVLDTDSQISRAIKHSKGLPYTVIVDKEGKIVFKHKGYKKGEEKLLEEKILGCLEKTDEDENSDKK